MGPLVAQLGSHIPNFAGCSRCLAAQSQCILAHCQNCLPSSLESRGRILLRWLRSLGLYYSVCVWRARDCHSQPPPASGLRPRPAAPPRAPAHMSTACCQIMSIQPAYRRVMAARCPAEVVVKQETAIRIAAPPAKYGPPRLGIAHFQPAYDAPRAPFSRRLAGAAR
jgi:hypothetical protein